MDKVKCNSKIIEVLKANAFACYKSDNRLIGKVLGNPDVLNYLDDLKLQEVICDLVNDKNFKFDRDDLLQYCISPKKDYEKVDDSIKEEVEINTSFTNYFKLDERQYVVFIKIFEIIKLFEADYFTFNFASYNRLMDKRSKTKVNYKTKYNSGIINDALLKKPLMFYSNTSLKNFEKDNAVHIEKEQLECHYEETFKRLCVSCDLKSEFTFRVKDSYLPVIIYDRGVCEI